MGCIEFGGIEGVNMAFPVDLSSRNKYILDSIKIKQYDVEWLPIRTSNGKHDATFYVCGDAIKVEGVRVNVSADMQQQIADMLDCMLLTPKLADLMFDQADVKLEPLPRQITSSTQAMIEQSEKIDNLLKGKDAKGKIIATVGKHWCIGNKLKNSSKAMNYGWHFKSKTGSFKGIKGYACDSKISEVYVIQPSVLAHDKNHTDYSQICVLVKQDCLVDCKKMNLKDVLSDPEFADLASHEGVVSILRQPGT